MATDEKLDACMVATHERLDRMEAKRDDVEPQLTITPDRKAQL